MDSNNIPSLKDLPPKQQVAANLAVANPDKNKKDIGRLLCQLGLIEDPDTIYKWQSIDVVKQALDLYGHTKLLAPAYKLHANELERISDFQQAGEEISNKDMKWVIEAERIKSQAIDINMPEVVNHQHLHAILDLKTREYKGNRQRK